MHFQQLFMVSVDIMEEVISLYSVVAALLMNLIKTVMIASIV